MNQAREMSKYLLDCRMSTSHSNHFYSIHLGIFRSSFEVEMSIYSFSVNHNGFVLLASSV